MNTKLLLTCLAVLVHVTSFTQRKDNAAVEEVELIERKRFDAQVNKDYNYLEKVFSPDLIYIHSGGAVNTKEEYIQSIRDGKSVYEKIDIEEMKLRAYNDGKTVVINGKITITLPPVDGKPNLSHLRYVVVYIKKKEGWQLVTWQSLKLV
jgi:ketosteroid isomerase-like protein